ncbi:MAG: prolipoprotein diacylglyceryl transferase [Gemmatimonadaceae bacterium]
MFLASEPTIHHALNIAVGPLTITGFGIAVATAFVLGQMIASHEMERRGFSANPVPDIVAATLVGFIIGAKIYYAVLTHSLDSLFTRGGFVFWGGFAGSVAAGAIMIRVKKLRFWHVADVFCIGLSAGYSVGRTGCWAVGDDYGKPWPGGWLAVKFPEGVPPSTAGNMTSSFGVHFPQGTNPLDVIAVYPTQLLEVLLGFVVFLLVWRLREHKHAEGWLFGVWAVYAGVERFLVEFLRAKDDRIAGVIGGLSTAQLISVGILIFGIIWMRMRRDVTPAHPGIHAP